ncbi:LOW QUALITY PROTEIN: uncharacterized protein Dana_GF11791 [Drosophila ananassae]|uniref:Serine/threonine-protein kinase ATM n=2 Tax=Drosophila ananassae TaxID=7217 RepID=B3MX95_DROAN|nr:LOW QUALITY PROTEIN: uncharacterized protein Dana_GF11791 [Drosophila ananassae]
MSGLLNDIQRILSEVCSDKTASCHKAIQQLDEKLSSCREDMNGLLLARTCDLTWTVVFEAAKEALIKHAAKLQAANEKTFKTLAGKCYLFSNVLDKIVKYNLEAGLETSGNGHFLARTSIFNAFEEGIKMRVTVKYFGDTILNLSERGIYPSASYVKEMKINEYSRILSYLFELNVDGDEFLSTRVLKCITKTVSLAKDRVQLHADLAAYLPELTSIAGRAQGPRKTEIVRLYSLFVTELSVNYHYQLCVHMQDVLPKLCEFHNEDVYRDDTRNIFFQCVIQSLKSMYPKLDQCDFNTFGVLLQENWPKTIMRLKTIVNMEISKNSLVRYKTFQLSNDKFSQPFLQMSALIMYIVLWHLDVRKPDDSGEGDAPKKLAKPSDKMEVMFGLIAKTETTFNDVWFGIFAELLQLSSVILNVANYQQALTTVSDILQIYGNFKNLRNVRLCLDVLLKKEKELVESLSIQKDFLGDLWVQMGNHLISESTTNSEEINERQLVLQMLIRHKKLNQKMVTTLLQNITSNEIMRRNECIATIREIYIHAAECGLEKSSADLEPILAWAYSSGARNSVTHLIHNIASIDTSLQADTFSICIINFLDEKQQKELSNPEPIATLEDQNTLLFKYNKKLVFMGKDYVDSAANKALHQGETKNCFFQTKYECLMRNLNFNSVNDNESQSIKKNLSSLHKLVCTMERLLFYKVFDAGNFTGCPLIKRIGLFLSHIEFHYKANDAKSIKESDLLEILGLQIAVLEAFRSNVILLNYLNTQPLEMLVDFVKNSLKLHCRQRDSLDHDGITNQCIQILGALCAFSSYRDESFEHLSKTALRWKPQDVLIAIKMLYFCESISDDACTWLVEKLKHLFLHYHQDLNIIDQVVEYMPKIFSFVYQMENLLDDMLMALNSLLRIALKKSYTSKLTAKIVRCVGLIAQRCPDIYLVENFTVICKSTAKFIAMPTLEVRYATLFSFIILLNTNCVTADVIGHSQSHWNFCQEVYDSIEFKKLAYNDEDATQNATSIVVQMLIAFIIRSSFHQEIALKELCYHIASRKLSEGEFYFLQNVDPCYGKSIRDLIQPYTDDLLHHWAEQNWPLSKFPYFLCYETKIDFHRAHINSILAYTFLYGKPEDVDRLKKALDEEIAYPLISSFMLPKNVSCSETEREDFKDRYQQFEVNVTNSQIESLKIALNAETLWRTTNLLYDPQELQRLLGPSVPLIEDCSWYNLKSKSLFKCINWHIDPNNNSSRGSRIQSMSLLQLKHPRILVDLFGRLKMHCFNATFPSQVVHEFFLYCAIADAVYDSALESEGAETVVKCSYFVRDIWFFLVRFLKHSKSIQVQMSIVSYLEVLLSKHIFGFDEFTSHMAEIAKHLIAFEQHCKFKDVKKSITAVIEKIVDYHKSTIDMPTFLEETTECEFLQPLREEFGCSSSIDKSDITKCLNSFLKSPTSERLRDLRDYIAEHKDKLQANEKLLFEVINRLVQMARDTQNKQTTLYALKCLAQIGPLKLSNISYYFQTEFDSFEEPEKEPMERFLSAVCEALEKYMFDFDPKTHDDIVCVAYNVVNSKAGIKIINKYKNLKIFLDKSAPASYLNSHKQIRCIDWLKVLKATQRFDYESWLCAFVSLAFKDCGWAGFDALAEKSFAFAKICLQPFIKLLLANNPEHLQSLCQMLDYFFENFVNTEQSGSVEIFQNKRAIKRFLYICECIRNFNNWSIPVNLSNVVRASNHCQAYFLSIMYLELWASSPSTSDSATLLEDESFQASAKKAYESIGCLDAIAGIVNPMRCRMDFLSRNNNLSAILMETDDCNYSSGQVCADIMKSNGLWSFAMLQQHQQVEPDYEILWRLGRWDSLHETQQQQLKARTKLNLEREFQRHHFMALRSIGQREQENSLSAIELAYQCVGNILQDISVECLQSVYKYLTWLCSLQQAEDFCQIQFGSHLNPVMLTKLFGKWNTELELQYGNFSCKEFTIAHQIALFKMAGTRTTRRLLEFYKQNPIDTYLLKGIEECKSAGKLNLAQKYIGMLRELPDIKESTKISVLLEDAEVNVKMGHNQIAKAILEHVNTNQEFTYCLQRIPAIRMEGEFLMDSNADSLSSVQCQKFNAALKLIDDFLLNRQTLSNKYPHIFQWQNLDIYTNHQRTATYATMAKYADREYQQLYEYRHSQDYQTLIDIIEQNRLMASKVTQRENHDRLIISLQMKRYANLDESQLQHVEEKLTQHLCSAIKNHIAYCRLDSGFSSAAIYRIISLWFTNASNEKLQQCIKEELPTVPSYKFICAANQLIGRLNSKNTTLIKALVDLLVRCGQDHPHHILYLLYPLVFANLDGEHSNTERAGIAQRIIAKIGEKNPKAAACSKELESVLPALITFANEGTTENKQQVSDATRQKQFERVRRLRHLNNVHCPTLELPVSPSNEYNITSICNWAKEISQCGGLNAPVKVLCMCSDGQTRPQLIKGKDDLRQDAVMQQVFGIVNQLLSQDSEFIERKLKLRTYKVMPLSMRSGILEWCTNSIPVGLYLAGQGKGGAHQRYRPNDWPSQKCRISLGSHLKSSKEKRFKMYQEVCDHIKPVFHYFLLEKFPIPGVWFERRLAYTNSVATTSMVGYVLGIGDRHTQNILIDERTAEVIHIDFGIAFEQGKIQTTPETVPFRLTRDFVAPMGICGTKGVFAKSCEATMHILRRYKTVFTTILEVLLYDPLFIWGVLRKKQSSSQSEEESVNLVAQRALLLVQNKLEGREAGTLGDSNVEAQVERLINEATLPSNLCMLYPGWDPQL